LIQVTLLLAVVGKASVQRCAAQPGMGIKEGRSKGPMIRRLAGGNCLQLYQKSHHSNPATQ